MTTIFRNKYYDGLFRSTEIIGTFESHDDAEAFLNDHVLYGGEFKQIAPCGYERLNKNGNRVEHVVITPSVNRKRDINGRWITS
jgi:hypothetical protein